MMKTHRKNTNWPYMAILMCLFALSLTTPRHWRNYVRKNANRHVSAVTGTSGARPAPIAEPRAAAASPRAPASSVQPTAEAVMVDAPMRSPSVSSEISDELADSPPAESVAAPSALVRSPQPELSVHSLAQPQWVSASEKITRLNTVDPLPRLNRTPSIQPLLAQPPIAPNPGGVAPDDIADSNIDVAEVQPVRSASLPQSVTLIERLENLEVNGECSLWAYEVIDLLEQLATLDADDRNSIDENLKSLRKAVADADRAAEEAEKVDDPEAASRLRHARYALLRRLDVWQQAGQAEVAAEVTRSPSSAEVFRNISQSSDEVARAASQTKMGGLWKRYLMLDELRRLASEPGESAIARRRQVARRVLFRAESPGLSETQRRFTAIPSVKRLKTHLRYWAAEDVDVAKLLADVEQFEQDRSADAARRVAETYQRIRWSPVQAERDLAERIAKHYRNANVRLAVTDRFLNLMLPRIELKRGTINDTFLGNRVHGRKVWTTQLRTRLLPSRRRLRFALEAHGEIRSRTTALNSQATFHSRGVSRYHAGKLIQVGPRGMRLWPAIADVQSDSDLEDVETSYDGMWLIGSIAKNYARDQHEQMHDEAMSEVNGKIRREATRYLDAQVDRQINKFKTAFATHVLDPLKHLSLRPQPIQLVTTKERMVSRVRLATVHQLGAFTPRPRAPGDSLLSLQIHESAPGNIIEQLDLDGRTFTLRELRRWVHEKTGRTGRPNSAQPTRTDPLPADIEEELPEDVSITFADHQAVQIRFAEGRVVVTLNVKQLDTPNRRIKNFTVEAAYQLDSEGLEAKLVRKDALRLSGKKRINMRGLIVLRGIFGTVFSKNRPVELLGRQFSSRPGLEDVTVTQLVVRSGWIGLAIGPRRHARLVKPRPVVGQNTE